MAHAVAYVSAILRQKTVLLQSLKSVGSTGDSCYTKQCKVTGATIGQHLRHSLDHIRKVVDASRAKSPEVIDYDIRGRNTDVERFLGAAADEVLMLGNDLACHANLDKEVTARFLHGDGNFMDMRSNVSRELGFVSHHSIHHHATILFILRVNSFPSSILQNMKEHSPDFGRAPATATFDRQQQPLH